LIYKPEMSAKQPTDAERKIMLLHLKGYMSFQEAAKHLGDTDVKFAFRVVAYARYAVRKAYGEPEFGFSEGKKPYPPGSVGAELAKQYKDKIQGERSPLEVENAR